MNLNRDIKPFTEAATKYIQALELGMLDLESELSLAIEIIEDSGIDYNEMLELKKEVVNES